MCHCEHDGVILPPPKSGEGAAMRLQQPACLTHRLFDPDSETVLTHPVIDAVERSHDQEGVVNRA